MLKHSLLIFSLLLIISCIQSQENITVYGKIVAKESGEAVENVHIKVNRRNIITTSNSKGIFSITLPNKNNPVLVFSHTSFETVYEPISSLSDTIELNMGLKRKVEKLPEYEYNEGKPVTVFKSVKINIADYEFYNDKFLFLVYGKRLNKDSQIYLVDENENILSKHFIPGEPVELYNDYMGNVNLICKKAIYRVEVNKNKISIYELPLDEFNQLIKPIVDTLEGSILFSDFMQQFPKFKYYSFNPVDTSVKVIKEIVHPDMDWRYNFEYHFLNNADKQFAKRMAKRLKGYDKYDVAASMTGFAQSFLYEEIYAPLFIVNDTINIFDHHQNKIWKFINDTIQTDSIDINYHQPQKKSEWKRKLIMDEVDGSIYGLFMKNGYYYLKNINSSNGEVTTEKKLFYQFVDKVKIKDGYVYYTYKMKQTLQKKFLYKEAL